MGPCSPLRYVSEREVSPHLNLIDKNYKDANVTQGVFSGEKNQKG